MQLQTGLFIILACISFGKCQYPRSEFENVGLGEAPRGIYIPQDSFLNALRNPSYRTPIVPSYSMPQQSFSVQAPPATVQQDTMQEMEPNNEERKSRRRIHKRRRIYNEQIGSPQVYSPPQFENIPFGEVPAGVYIPPDSLLNALRTPYRSRDSFRPTHMMPNVNRNFEPVVNESPMNEQQQQTNPVRQSDSPSIQYVAPSADFDDGDYGRRRSSTSRRQQSTQGRRMPSVRPPSLVLDPSMEYPADKPREEMQSLPRTVEEYYDLEGNKAQDVSDNRHSRRKPSQRRRPQTRVKPEYTEPTYPPRSYSPSVFQNIGLGEAPHGVHIPEDSILNVLRQQRYSQIPQSTEPLPESYNSRVSADRIEPRGAYVEDVPQQQNMQARRNVSRQRSRRIESTEMADDGEYGSRRGQNEPVQSFRESSQRQRSQRRNSATNRRRQSDE